MQWLTKSTGKAEQSLEKVAQWLDQADAVLVGAGAGLSAACGPEFAYSGERFQRLFGDFQRAYGFSDMYSGGFYPYPTQEQFWAYWSRQIWYNRYACPVGDPYRDLLRIVRDRDYFVLTTNVDHQFQRAGFAMNRLFYTQGDYGLFQCSEPCHQKTYDNYAQVKQMVEQQHDLHIPSELVPHCPVCGKPMTTNLRCDNTFVQDDGWYAANARYQDFVRSHEGKRVVYLELGVGGNTPIIIKYPFWRAVAQNPNARYVQINMGEVLVPSPLADQSILLDADAADALARLADAR